MFLNDVKVSKHGRPMYCKNCTEGSLIVEFLAPVLSEESGALGTLRIKSWTFNYRRNQELIPRSAIALLQEQPALIDNFLKNITRGGLTVPTLQYLKLCSILEPMQELMGRHKAWAGTQSPRECLRAAAMQKAHAMRASGGPMPPGFQQQRSMSGAPPTQIDDVKSEAKAAGANQSPQASAAANATNGSADFYLFILFYLIYYQFI